VKLAILRSQSNTTVFDYTRYSAARQRYLGVATLKCVFENVASCNIIAYVKEIGFYSRMLCCFYISLIALVLTSILTLLLIHILTALN